MEVESEEGCPLLAAASGNDTICASRDEELYKGVLIEVVIHLAAVS